MAQLQKKRYYSRAWNKQQNLCKIRKYCRKVAIDIATIDPESRKIGGPGKTVEIDESVMEKRKTEIQEVFLHM